MILKSLIKQSQNVIKMAGFISQQVFTVEPVGLPVIWLPVIWLLSLLLFLVKTISAVQTVHFIFHSFHQLISAVEVKVLIWKSWMIFTQSSSCQF